MAFIKTKKEIEIMREAGEILATALVIAKNEIKIGAKGGEIDKKIENFILSQKAIPAFKGLYGFPATINFSLNNENVHGVPYKKILKDGDIISIDCGVLYKGYYSDAAFTVGVGDISLETKKLIQDTEKALQIGIKNSIIDNKLGDIGSAIQKIGEEEGYGVVRELCGHGIGKKLHQKPEVLNIGEKGKGLKIKEGMVFCLEPIFTLGDWRIKKGDDGFAWVTKDGSLSAHFEHTIAVTSNGPEILTKLSKS